MFDTHCPKNVVVQRRSVTWRGAPDTVRAFVRFYPRYPRNAVVYTLLGLCHAIGLTPSEGHASGYFSTVSSMQILLLPPSALLSMVHANPCVVSNSPHRLFFVFLRLPLPFSSAVPDLNFFFSTCYRLSLSVSLEHPRVTVRPRRWTGENWRFAIAATCSTASKAPKENYGVPSVTRFSPFSKEQSYLPIDTRLFPDPPMGLNSARSFNQSSTAELPRNQLFRYLPSVPHFARYHTPPLSVR